MVQSVNTPLTPMLPFIIQGKRVQACIDTGAQVTLMSECLYNSLSCKPDFSDKIKLRMAGDQLVDAHLVKNLEISFAGKIYKWNVYVTHLHEEFLLGVDFMHRFGAILNLKECTFSMGDTTQVIRMVKDENVEKPYEVSRVWVKRKLVIPPNRVVHVKAATSLDSEGTDFAISPSSNNEGLLVANVLVKGTPEVVVRIINYSDNYVYLKKNCVLGFAVEVANILEDVDGSGDAFEEHLVGSGTKESVRQVNISTGLDVPPDEQLPEHLEDLFKRTCDNLVSDDQRDKTRDLLCEYQDIFSKGATDLGCFAQIKHKIKLYDHAKPVRQPLRRCPIGFEGEEAANLQILLDNDVIQESCSEWASAPVLVRKRDGTVRYCIDFRVLNNLTVKDAYGIPSISQCLDQLDGCTTYSCLDLASGYHQVLLDEEDRHKTAFITKYGLYEHKRLPFGLCNSPSTFMRVMELVLRGLTWKELLVYLDDVIVLGRGFDDQIANLRTTFDRFRKYNLKLKPKKCDFILQASNVFG